MPAIFISYRRDDSSDLTGRLYDRLKRRFSEVFKDVDSISVGADFRTSLRNALEKSNVILAIIGRSWLSLADGAGRPRIQNGDDYVRLEIAEGLARGIATIPVLVNGASLPTPADLPINLHAIAFRQAAVLRPDPDFDRDVERLLQSLEVLLGVRRRSLLFLGIKVGELLTLERGSLDFRNRVPELRGFWEAVSLPAELLSRFVTAKDADGMVNGYKEIIQILGRRTGDDEAGICELGFLLVHQTITLYHRVLGRVETELPIAQVARPIGKQLERLQLENLHIRWTALVSEIERGQVATESLWPELQGFVNLVAETIDTTRKP